MNLNTTNTVSHSKSPIGVSMNTDTPERVTLIPIERIAEKVARKADRVTPAS